MHFVVKSIGKKDKRWQVYFSDGSLASNIRFKSKNNAKEYLKKLKKLK